MGQAKINRLATNRFVGNVDPAVGQQILDVSETQGKLEMQPNRLLDHINEEAVTTIGKTAHLKLIAQGPCLSDQLV